MLTEELVSLIQVISPILLTQSINFTRWCHLHVYRCNVGYFPDCAGDLCVKHSSVGAFDLLLISSLLTHVYLILGLFARNLSEQHD